MSDPRHEDLVELALTAPDDLPPSAEANAIRDHLDLHDAVGELTPDPAIWGRIEARLDVDEQPARSFLQRFWMPLAAAALVLVALYSPQKGDGQPRIVPLHGSVAIGADSTITTTTVARVRLGDGVLLTLDADTVVRPLSTNRLALQAGRIFLEVGKSRRGFTVETGHLTATTLGTAFLVEPHRVAVETGTVRCTDGATPRDVRDGEEFDVKGHGGPAPRAWFSAPSISARITAPSTVTIVFTNEMPDPITLAPPTGGEPFFYVQYPGRELPLSTSGFVAPVVIEPGKTTTFTLTLPAPAPESGPVVVSCPRMKLRAEVTR
ncbi:MAG: FecR domain-containing protein [Planctomycetota bacterium]